MTRILCLWLPNWPIQQLLRSRPELRERPVALVLSDPRGGRVITCCSKAAAQGVHPDMPLAEAQALVRDLVIAPYDPAADRQALEKLAAACERFAPCVALEEGDAPESLLLDISNLEHLYGSEARLVAQVKNFFTRRGYDVRLAVADTVGLAWALAHYGECGERRAENGGPAVEDKVPATTNKHSSFVIRHSSFKHSSDLPVEALRIPGDTVALLHQLGIRTVGQLLSLPREDLMSRFGESLLRRLDQLTGAAPEVIEPHRPLAALEAACALEEPTADRATLMHVLDQLVDRLARQLAARDQGAVVLLCWLYPPCGTPGIRDGRGDKQEITPFAKSQVATGDSLRRGVPPHERAGRAVPLRIGLLEPSANARQMMELIELHLETLTLAEEVDRVEIRAAVVGRLSERQRELFADGWPTDPHQLALLVGRLSSRLGDERVLRAELRKSPVPERAVRWTAMTQRPARSVSDGTSRSRRLRSGLAGFPSSRPLLLHPQPQPVEVVCVAPDGPPQFVWLENRRERIVACAGPERIETLWWRGPALRRDYYRAATESGSSLWLFRQITDARWFLHGVFA